MNLIKKIILFSSILILTCCADYKSDKSSQEEVKKYYSTSGFALVYEDFFYKQGVINKKLNNEHLIVMHSLLKKSTPVRIINPDNLKTIETTIFKKAKYPKIFKMVISQKIAEILELDPDNPYVELIEIKKNKTFVAKKGKMFEEEKQVAETVRIDEIQIDNLTEVVSFTKKKLTKKNNFILAISDFYYLVSANNLRDELIKKTLVTNFSVKKINNNKYRLFVGPFKNFNALKSIYISLNNLGFEDLNIYRE